MCFSLLQLQYAAIGISDKECFEEDELLGVVNHHQAVNGSGITSSTSSEEKGGEEETLFDEPKYVKGGERNVQ